MLGFASAVHRHCQPACVNNVLPNRFAEAFLTSHFAHNGACVSSQQCAPNYIPSHFAHNGAQSFLRCWTAQVLSVQRMAICLHDATPGHGHPSDSLMSANALRRVATALYWRFDTSNEPALQIHWSSHGTYFLAALMSPTWRPPHCGTGCPVTLPPIVAPASILSWHCKPCRARPCRWQLCTRTTPLRHAVG